jgi:4'-phosphopantetheinyl transferase
MQIYWFEQTEGDLPASNDWLSESEFETLFALRFPKRRADWRLGRWTAKRAVASVLGGSDDHASLRNIVICPAGTGEPRVNVVGCEKPVTISLSHRDGRGACAVAFGAQALGCDLELIEAKSDAFISDYFTSEEQELVASVTPALEPLAASLLWSAKESALKALHVGLRADTRSAAVNVALQNVTASSVCDWQHFLVLSSDSRMFYGWWHCKENVLRTVVTDTSAGPPFEILPDVVVVPQKGCTSEV